MRALSTRARAVVAVSLGTILLGAALAAPAAPAKVSAPTAAGGECDGSIPDSKIAIQLWNFAAYVGFDTDPATQQRAEEVLARLSEMGYRNVEPFTLNGRTAAQYKALLKKYHLKARSRHGDTNEATWDAELAVSKTLGQKFVGSGGFAAPGIGSYEDTLATAETMNRLGKRSVRNGTGMILGHNHQGEFRTTYVDPATGETKSAWQIIVENTDPRYVGFQLDVLWATDGGADPVELLNRYGDRIKALHVKDGINVADPANATPVPMGEGEMVFEPILAAAEDHVRYYIYEQDPPFGDPTFDPFASAQRGIDYLDCVTF